jgi:hypothetical protein
VIADHAVHACVWLAVRCLPWSMAVPAVRALRPVIPSLADEVSARRSLRVLRGGTCLTRSLAISVRLPGSEVAIGVRRERGSVKAHAWVVMAGAPLECGEQAGSLITSVDLAAASR